MNNASQNRILFLYKWLNEETDCDHPLTSKEILERWDQLGFSTDRRSVYKDIETLQSFGVKVVSCRGTYNSYFLEEKQFSLAELKIIIDALESCQILPAPETKRLVEKLSFFAAPWEQEELLRPIFVDKAYKNTNHQVFITTDTLFEAIKKKKKVTFNYTDYSVDKRKIYKHDKYLYTFSPYYLKWDRDRYYVVGYSDDHENISHFRVDRIANIKLLDAVAQKKPKGFSPAKYATQVFGMYSSCPCIVTLRCANERMRDVIDKFGKNIPVNIVDDNHFETMIEVEASPPFFAWVFQFAGDVLIVSPDEVKNKFDDMVAQFH